LRRPNISSISLVDACASAYSIPADDHFEYDEGLVMKIKLLGSLMLAAAIGIGSAAFAAGLDGLKYKMERTVKLKSGKEVTVMFGEMNGKMMAVIPMEDLNDIFARAEGHSMSETP
jgi:hypothetical protein